jgi:hypothetical protein
MSMVSMVSGTEIEDLHRFARERADKDDPYWGPIYNVLNWAFFGGKHPEEYAPDKDPMPPEASHTAHMVQRSFAKITPTPGVPDSDLEKLQGRGNGRTSIHEYLASNRTVFDAPAYVNPETD